MNRRKDERGRKRGGRRSGEERKIESARERGREERRREENIRKESRKMCTVRKSRSQKSTDRVYNPYLVIPFSNNSIGPFLAGFTAAAATAKTATSYDEQRNQKKRNGHRNAYRGVLIIPPANKACLKVKLVDWYIFDFIIANTWFFISIFGVKCKFSVVVGLE